MAQTPVGTKILRNMVGNAGAALVPRTGQRVGPGTSDPGLGLHITPRPGGTAPHPPTGVGTKILGQVLRLLASTSMAPVNLSFYLIPGHSAAALENALLLKWGVT